MKRLIKASLLIGSVLGLYACTNHNDKDAGPNETYVTIDMQQNTSSKEKSTSEMLLEQLTIEEKVGQLFMIRPDALDPNRTVEQVNVEQDHGVMFLSDEMIDTLQNYPVSGVVMFSKNIESLTNLKKMNEELQKHTKIPLLIGVDEEGGAVARIASAPGFDQEKFSSMESLGKQNDSNLAYHVGETIGTYLKEYGFNLDFAPDADVNNNPKNRVIGNRSFGSDPNLVADYVAKEIQGFHDVGMLCCAKHFPGHGNTFGDTHDNKVELQATWQELQNCELIPFQSAIEQNVDMIMISHIHLPNATTDQLPSSLSKQVIENKLRKQLGFEGVIITDAMAMGAITKHYTSKEAAVLAIEAGADIVLMPMDFQEAYNGVLDEVKSGHISIERLDQSVLRILKLKEKLK